MKKISILIVSLILLLVVGCEKNSKEVVEEGKIVTPDIGGHASTTEFTQAIIAKL